MNREIIERLEEQFTVVYVDYYNNGEIVDLYVFFADEVGKDEAYGLYDEYEEKYNNDEFDASFEEYLQEKGIRYYIFKN